MNILFFAKRYEPHIGGVEKHLNAINQVLKKNHRITVVTEKHDPELKDEEVIDEVRVLRIPVGKKSSEKLQVWGWLFSHRDLLTQANIIHIHDVFFWFLPFRFLFPRKKVFMTFHGYEAPGPPTKKQVFWHKVAALLTEGNICIGGFHQKWYGVVPDFISYGGVESEQQKLSTKEVKKKHREVVFVGRLAEDTGIVKYIDALKILNDQKEKIHCTVVGDGPLKKELEKKVHTWKLPVSFVGAQHDPSTYYQHADVAYVSGYLSILQALSFGLPVVATYHNQIKKDYLTLTPFAQWITITADAQKIAERLKDTMSLEHGAQNWAVAQTWKKLAEHYQNLWKKNE